MRRRAGATVRVARSRSRARRRARGLRRRTSPRRAPAARRCRRRWSTATATARSSAGPGSRCATARSSGGPGRPAPCSPPSPSSPTPHVRDEESPARVPFLDRLGGAFRSTFRPQEALSPQVLAAAVRAVNRARPDAVLVTGDLVDSAAEAELDQALALLDGGRVEPGHRRPRLRRRAAGERPRPALLPPRPRRPAPSRASMAAAQRPFTAPGLAAPWLPAVGNHDVLVQGEVPPTARIDARRDGRAHGRRARSRPCCRSAAPTARRRSTRCSRPGAPGRALRVPADPARRAPAPRRAARAADRPARRAGRRCARAAGRADARLRRRPRARTRACSCSTPRTARAARAGGSARRSCAWLRSELRRAAGRAIVVAAHNPLDEHGGRRGGARGARRRRRASSPSSTATGIATRSARGAPRAAATGWSARPRWPTSPSRRARSACGAAPAATCSRPGCSTTTAPGSPAPRASSPSSTPRAGARRASRARAATATSGCSCPVARVAGGRSRLPRWRRRSSSRASWAGALHFVAPRPYERIMPAALPAHRALVYASGVGGDRRRAGRAASPHARGGRAGGSPPRSWRSSRPT